MSHDQKQELISREIAINLLCKTGCDMERAHKLMLTTHEAKQWAVDVIDSVPAVGFSAGAYGAWIPVDEKLPEPPFARAWYLVALKSGCVMTLAFEKDRNDWAFIGPLASPVTHWMPLPEPPVNKQTKEQ